MSDDADKKATEILPCQCSFSGYGPHKRYCPVNHRQVVAAALRERNEALNNLRVIHRESAERFITDREQLQGEIARITAELQEAQDEVERMEIVGREYVMNTEAKLMNTEAKLAKAAERQRNLAEYIAGLTKEHPHPAIADLVKAILAQAEVKL